MKNMLPSPTVAAAVLLCVLLAGCGQRHQFPPMRLDDVTVPNDPTASVSIPRSSAVTNRAVSAALLGELPPRPNLMPMWAPSPADSFDPAKALSMTLVRFAVVGGFSPYSSGRVEVFSRVIVKTADGKFYFTHALDAPRAMHLPGKCIPTDYFSFESPHGVLQPNGLFSTQPMDPLTVAETGYCATVSLRGTKLSESLVVPPDFSGLRDISYDAPAGRPGADGGTGASGAAGSAGADGFGGSEGSSHLSRRDRDRTGGTGGDGAAGSDGTNGLPGNDGERGRDGTPAGELRLTIAPLNSPFAERPLVRITASSRESTRNFVATWGQQLTFLARGGDGGKGGRGGDGGNGGNGGAGGDGGRGGNGGHGPNGLPGFPGEKGADATRDHDAEPGTQGGNGMPGGRGGDGGNGGDAGDAGDGGNGANGADGGDGGSGGNGAQVVVVIEGDEEFIRACKAAMVFDVSGGASGEASDAGGPGIGGRAGDPGSPGTGGFAGDGGYGGPGGEGGPGGRGCTWTEIIKVDGKDVEVKKSRPAAANGDHGPYGRPGFHGDEGPAGNPSNAGNNGPHGQNGNRGNPGQPGQRGVVTWQERTPTPDIACDLRIIRVADASLVATASAKGAPKKLDALADDLAAALKKNFPAKGETIALASLRNRAGTPHGATVTIELADKLTAALAFARWFDVKERIDLTSVLTEKDLDQAEIVKQAAVRQKLGAVKYIVIGGVTVPAPRE